MGAVRPPADVAVGVAARREAEGFDAVWWADHLLHWFPLGIWDPELVPQAAVQASPHVWLDPVPVIAQAAVATDRIRLGIGVTDLVRRNPASLAQTALILDHLTGWEPPATARPMTSRPACMQSSVPVPSTCSSPT